MAKQNKHTKEQIVLSEKYGKYSDLLNAVLESEMLYTAEEIENIINDYMEKRVE